MGRISQRLEPVAVFLRVGLRFLHKKGGNVSTEDRCIQKKRLLHRATHRGTKESDAIVGGYVTANIDELTEAQLDTLEVVLDCSDPDLMDWLSGRQPMPEDGTAGILKLIKDYQQNLLTD
ncbi:MAG: succinate dehydrogenase assembly factor 2 [Rhodospirillaceae bacterium]|jgi:antitoxin CptB|nr:succinate dehydrogenase assembly factor 2 [Rhodospirillaceae bacterium]